MYILDPRSQVQPGRREPIPGVADLQGKTIGVLDNGLMNSTPLMKEVTRLLGERYGQVVFRTKPSQSRGAPTDWLDDFAAKCHVIVTGVGD